MKESFEACFAVVVGEEGGYTNDANDPGGETNWGISRAAYPALDIKGLTRAEAQAIYLRDYWAPSQCDRLPPPLAMLVFDAAVNNGVQRAREWLQAALGVPTDGVIGPQTLAALKTATATHDGLQGTCAELLARRVDFMGGLKTWQSFGLGWSRRLCALPWKAMSLTTTEGV